MLTSLSALGRLKTAHGFTLLEAMVVLVIIGILFVFAKGAFQRQREKEQLGLAQTMLSAYAQELGVFQMKAGRLPINLKEYDQFKKSMTRDPNRDQRYKDYFQTQPEFEQNVLKAVPGKKHPFHSYAKMDLNNYAIYICRHTSRPFTAEGGDCKRVITENIINQ